MRGNRLVIAVVAVAVLVIVAIAFFGEEFGKRALPPQATVPQMPTAPAAGPRAPSDVVVPPSFDVVRVSRNCTAVIAGRAEPGARVIVKAGERELGRVTADGRGEWALVPDLPLPSGPQELALAAELNGQQVIESAAVVVVVVPDCTPGQPDAGEQVIAVLTPKSGASRLLQAPPAPGDGIASKGLSLDTIDYDDKGNLLLSGKAPPGATVQVYVNNQPVGTATADAKGRWELKLGDSVPPGVYTLRIDQVEETGKVFSRLELPFQRAAPSEIEFGPSNVVVQPGNSLWRIARRVYGEGVKYTVIFRANKDQIRDPDLIYPGQVFALPKTGADSTTN